MTTETKRPVHYNAFGRALCGSHSTVLGGVVDCEACLVALRTRPDDLILRNEAGDVDITLSTTDDPDWPVQIQIDDIAVQLDIEDVGRLTDWLVSVHPNRALPVIDDAGLGGSEVPC